MKIIRVLLRGVSDSGDILGSGETDLDAINNAIANPSNNIDLDGIKTFPEFKKAFGEIFEDYSVIITENELETSPILGNADNRIGVKVIPGLKITVIGELTDGFYTLEVENGENVRKFTKDEEINPNYSIRFDFYPFLSDLNRIETESELNALIEKYEFKAE